MTIQELTIEEIQTKLAAADLPGDWEIVLQVGSKSTLLCLVSDDEASESIKDPGDFDQAIKELRRFAYSSEAELA